MWNQKICQDPPNQGQSDLVLLMKKIGEKNKCNMQIYIFLGAHYVIDTINDLPGIIEKINERLAMGMGLFFNFFNLFIFLS